jgi:hypothetical protein
LKRGSFWKTIVIWILVIAVLAMIMQPHRTVSTEGFDGRVEIQSRSGYTLDIVYDQVEKIELRENLDYGRIVDGTDEKKEKSGLWENEEFGEYHLCVNEKVDSCIVLWTSSDVLVVNYESDKSTESLYEAILKQI